MFRYVVGDEVMARMELWHRMNLLDVSVVFEHHEDPAITLTLSGVPKFVRYVPSQDRPDTGSSTGEIYRESEVCLRGEVDLEHLPGEYTVSRAEFYTASGQEIQHDLRADKPFPSRISVKDPTFLVVPDLNSIDKADVELIDEQENPISEQELEQLKLVIDYVKFHMGLYLVTPSVLVLIGCVRKLL